MGGTEILLIAAVVVVPLAIAVAVTLWTLEPAAQRAERAKRARKRSGSTTSATQKSPESPIPDADAAEVAIGEKSHRGAP